MSRNDEVADRLETVADHLAARDVDYKPRAYRDAAQNVRSSPVPVERLAEEGPEAVARIDAVGEAISEKIVEYLDTGSIAELDELREALPVEMDALTNVEGVGPKTVKALYDALGVTTLDELEAAAEAEEIRTVSGFGPKTEANILEAIPFAREASKRQRLGEARPRGEHVREHLAGVDAVDRVELAGSLRRWRETIGDVDVLVGSDAPDAVVAAFTGWDEASEVIEAGDTKASVMASDARVDLRVVTPAEFGSALQYFTGSKDHNVTLRNRAIDRGLKMNEYGTFDVSHLDERAAEADQRAGERVAGETEASMYDALDLPWIPPELREDRGEIEAAAAGDLPDLVTVEAIRGDLHTHTDWSDGKASIAEWVATVADYGHDYVAITDHATGPGMVGGVGVADEELVEQRDAVADAAADADVEVFTGVEANIDADGGLSVADDVLDRLDVVVASPHAGLDGAGTDRLIAAATHPAVSILGHPTGRYINERPGLDVDIERLAAAAADHDTALEVNAHPARLDLGDRAVTTAIEAGATIAVNTDAHRRGNLDLLRYGVHTARRGWAEAADVLNTRDAEGVRAFLE
jgi:DNA polymerase (family 10)